MRGLIRDFIIGCCLVSSTAFADARSDLLKRGVRVSSTSATLAAESDVANRLKDVAALRRKLFQATSQYEDHKKADETLNAQISRLNQQLVGLNAQLANVSDAVTNNRLIGAIGAVEGQLRLAYENRQQREKQEASLHEQISAARDALITHIFDMRKAADDVARQYYEADKNTQELIGQLNQASNSRIALQPSSVFLTNLRKLNDLEGDILSEDIKLRREGNTYWANVKFNGENSLDMVVDSGATTILLSTEDAAKVGLKPGEKDPLVRLGVADGRSTTGRVMSIKSMQLGQFNADNVECVVLNAEAGRAAPLLGMTFLGRFKFQLDGGKSTLSLTKVKDQSESAEKSSRSSKLPPVQLIKSDWELVPAATGVSFWKNRQYKIESVPNDLKKASLILRKLDDRDWLSGQVVALQPASVFVALRSSYSRGKGNEEIQDLDDATLARLKGEGWNQIEGFSAPTNARENLKWVLLQKKFEPGPITVPQLVPNEDAPVLFFVGPL